MRRLQLTTAGCLWGASCAGLGLVAWLAPPAADAEATVAFRIALIQVAGLTGLLSLLASWPLAWLLQGPLSQMRAVLDQMARGLHAPRLPWHGRDVLGEIARAIRSLAIRTQKTLDEVTSEKERLQAVLQGMAEGVLVLDPEGRVELANSRVRELFGAWGKVTGRTPLEVIRRAEIDAALRRAREAPEPVTCEVTLGDEGSRTVQMHAVRFPLEGPTLGTVAVFHDLTDVHRLEDVRKEFVANVSHELKTPLTAIRGFAETLQHDGLTSEQREQYTDVILRHSDRLTALIDDLLELSRIEGRRQRLEPSEVPLGDVARALLRDLKPRIEASGLEASVEVVGEPRALADRRAVEQILLNLLDNAIKYTEAGGRLRVDVTERGDRVHVVVEDDGIGVPEADLSRIFERFYRVDKARSRDLGGTGLGLAIVKHLVHAMGGDVTVESGEGRGTRFRFSLPRSGAAPHNVTPS